MYKGYVTPPAVEQMVNLAIQFVISVSSIAFGVSANWGPSERFRGPSKSFLKTVALVFALHDRKMTPNRPKIDFLAVFEFVRGAQRLERSA